LIRHASSASTLDPPAVASWLQTNLSWIPGWGEKRPTSLAPLYLGGVDTLVWGFLVSLVLGFGVSWASKPDHQLAAKYFPDATTS